MTTRQLSVGLAAGAALTLTLTASNVEATQFDKRVRFFQGYDVQFGDSTLVQTSDGGAVQVGTLTDASGNADVLVVKTDSSGNLEWANTYGGKSSAERGNAIIELTGSGTDEVGFLAVGSTDAPSGGNDTDVLAVNIAPDGHRRWVQHYGKTGSHYERATAVVDARPYHGYIIAGETVDVTLPIPKLFLAAVYEYGGLRNSVEYDLAGQFYERYARLDSTGRGSYVLVSETRAVATFPAVDMLVLEFDGTLNPIQNRTYKGAQPSTVLSLDDGYLIGGIRGCIAPVASCGFLLRLTPSLDIMWERSYYVQDNENYILDAAPGPFGGFVLAGMSNSSCGSLCPVEGLLFAVDDNGDVQWGQSSPRGPSRQAAGHWLVGVDLAGSEIVTAGVRTATGASGFSLTRTDALGGAPCNRPVTINESSAPWTNNPLSIAVTQRLGEGWLQFKAIEAKPLFSDCE